MGPPAHAGLLAGIAARAARPEYALLLADCMRAYFDARLGLVAGITAERVAAFAREPLPSLTRSGCSYLMQVRARSLASWCRRRARQALLGCHRPLLAGVTSSGFLGPVQLCAFGADSACVAVRVGCLLHQGSVRELLHLMQTTKKTGCKGASSSSGWLPACCRCALA